MAKFFLHWRRFPMMNENDFRFLVMKSEQEAERNPEAYRRKVLGLVLLGYGYVILLFFAILAGLVWLVMSARAGHLRSFHIFVGFSLISVGFAALRALWVPMGEPEGRELTAEEAPKFFKLLDKVRRKTGGPQVYRVLVTTEFNASVVQVRRHGMVGAMRNYLIVGLPLVMSVSMEQFAAILAHEYGHFAGGHSAFGAWIYRTRTVWMRFLDRMEDRSDVFTKVSLAFFRRYIPYFQAFTFALARRNEYEADGASARVVSPQQAGDALIETDLKYRFLEREYWPGLYRQADQQPRPPWLPYQRMAAAMRAGFDRDHQGRTWLDEALREITRHHNTHPALADRLHGLEVKPRLPPAPPISAAEVLLHPALPKLIDEFDRLWLQAVEEGWRGRYDAAADGRHRIAELEGREGKSPKEWMLLGELQEDLVSVDAALESYRQAIKWAPHFAPGHYAVGRILCDRGDEAGIAAMEAAMRQDKGYGLWGCDWVIHYLNSINATRDRVRPWEARRQEFSILEDAAWDELLESGVDDGAMPHGLGRDQLRRTLTALINDKRVRAAWLVAKKVSVLPDRLYYILLVDEVRDGRELASALVNEVRLPGHFLVLPKASGQWSPRDVESYAGAPIYRRR